MCFSTLCFFHIILRKYVILFLLISLCIQYRCISFLILSNALYLSSYHLICSYLPRITYRRAVFLILFYLAFYQFSIRILMAWHAWVFPFHLISVSQTVSLLTVTYPCICPYGPHS
jgi:hypothetical protein